MPAPAPSSVTDASGGAPTLDRLLDVMEAHVVFDGWSESALAASAAELGLTPGTVAALAPGGVAGLAAAWHRRGDQHMQAALAGPSGATALAGLRFRDRVARAVRLRIEGEDREVVRHALAFFALPANAPLGARLLWGSADAIWRALGDSSQDVNWYSKRLTLSGVLSSTQLYWLGDSSEGAAETWAFLDRRIEDVMRIEKAKAQLRRLPFWTRLAGHPLNPLTRIHAPQARADRWPGHHASDGRGPAAPAGTAPPPRP